MPQIFKALASIAVWILFVAGSGYFIAMFVWWAAAGFGTENWQVGAAYDALGVAAIILSVVAMKLRKDLE